MNRTKKLKLNVIFTVLNQLIVFLSGFILPKLIIDNYGSEINGLVSSITQFLSVIMFCEMGVGAVVQSALYKPISENDTTEISKIYCSAQRFFRNIAYILVVYIGILCIAYPFIVESKESWIGIVILLLAISFKMFVQYYFSLTYRLILISAQMTFVPMLIGSVTLVLNIALTYLLIKLGRSIQEVQIVSSLIFLIQPVAFGAVVNRLYSLNKHITYKEEPIKQKWNGFAQHLASITQENSPAIILTVFTSVATVSVYAIYHMVANGIKLVFISFMTSVKSLLGDMYVKNETALLNKTFDMFEWASIMGATLFYTVAAITIIPFIEVYLGKNTDINYIYPAFGAIICLYMAVYTIRIPYSFMIQAAGHFKQTQNSAFIELFMSLILSCCLVARFGLIGVSLGAVVAIGYRTIYFVYYLQKNILYRNVQKTVFMAVIAISIIATIWLLSRFIVFEGMTLFSWIWYAIKVFILATGITLVINIIFYKSNLILLFNKILRK